MIGNNFTGTFKAISGLGYHIVKSQIIKKRAPIFLSLFITNHCNLRCKYCFVVDENIDKSILSAEYTTDEVFRIVDEFYAMGTRMIFILGGEPLLHKDIGPIIDYIVAKGIYLHVVTNGTLIEKRLDEIKKVHALCISLDGVGIINDEMRGRGCFEKAVQGIRAAVKAGVLCRIHGVLTRRNLKDIRPIAELSRSLGVSFTISPPNFLGSTDLEYLKITQNEYKEFWKDYLQMQQDGLPIANSPEAIRKCIDWPKDYHQYIKAGEKFCDYKPTFCLNGYTYAALGAEGTMYNCINLGCLNGPNIKEMGISMAWERLLDWRPDCISCASINCIETALMLNIRLKSLFSGFDFHFRK